MQDNRKTKTRRAQVYDVSDSSFHNVEVRGSPGIPFCGRTVFPLMRGQHAYDSHPSLPTDLAQADIDSGELEHYDCERF